MQFGYTYIFYISSPVDDHIINGAQTHFWYTILLSRRVSATCVCAPPTAARCSAENHQTRPGVPVTLTMSEPPTGSEDDKTKKRKVMPRVLCTTHWPAFIPSITTHSSSTTTSPLYTTLCFTQSKTRPVIHSTSCCSPLVLVVSSVRYQSRTNRTNDRVVPCRTWLDNVRTSSSMVSHYIPIDNITTRLFSFPFITSHMTYLPRLALHSKIKTPSNDADVHAGAGLFCSTSSTTFRAVYRRIY